MAPSRLDLSGLECLVVISEAPVRGLIEALLRRHGLAVSTTSTAAEALNRLRAPTEGFHALIVDAETAGEHAELLRSPRTSSCLASAPARIRSRSWRCRVLNTPFRRPVRDDGHHHVAVQRYGRSRAGALPSQGAELDLCSGAAIRHVVADGRRSRADCWH